jgi:carbamoyl-phosphate synthase large subunit
MPNDKPLHVLITSVSRKVPLVREVRKALEKLAPGSRIIGADSNPDTLGRYFVDGFWEMPPLKDLSAEDIVNYCLEHQIAVIIPTRDGELEFFARSKPLMNVNGISVMISPLDSVRICLDKLLFFKTLKDLPDVRPIPTTLNPDSLNGSRWVVKEQYGSGSRSIRLNLAGDDAKSAGKKLVNPVFQPYIEGREFSVDIYINQAGESVGAVTRSRDRIVEGESQVTTTIELPEIEKMCSTVARLLNLTSHLVFQVIVDLEGTIHLVECNCRFGGASSLSVAAGLDSFYWYFLECAGEDLCQIRFDRKPYQLQQVRYPEDKIVPVEIG